MKIGIRYRFFREVITISRLIRNDTERRKMCAIVFEKTNFSMILEWEVGSEIKRKG